MGVRNNFFLFLFYLGDLSYIIKSHAKEKKPIEEPKVFLFFLKRFGIGFFK